MDRSVLVVQPETPFLDWVSSLDDAARDYTLEDLRQEGTAYLIPPLEGEDHLEEILLEVHSMIFAQELAAWHTDESIWPSGRCSGSGSR